MSTMLYLGVRYLPSLFYRCGNQEVIDLLKLQLGNGELEFEPRSVDFKAAFLNPGTIDISALIAICWGTVQCTAGCMAAPLASTF